MDVTGDWCCFLHIDWEQSLSRMVGYVTGVLTTVSKTCCILTETTGIFCILTWWVCAHTYKEYVAKNMPQRHSVLREILHFLATHHHQQWADISQNGKAKGRYFHYWKPTTGSQSAHYIMVSIFRYLTLKINLWISQSNQHQILSYNHI